MSSVLIWSTRFLLRSIIYVALRVDDKDVSSFYKVEPGSRANSVVDSSTQLVYICLTCIMHGAPLNLDSCFNQNCFHEKLYLNTWLQTPMKIEANDNIPSITDEIDSIYLV